MSHDLYIIIYLHYQLYYHLHYQLTYLHTYTINYINYLKLITPPDTCWPSAIGLHRARVVPPRRDGADRAEVGRHRALAQGRRQTRAPGRMNPGRLVPCSSQTTRSGPWCQPLPSTAATTKRPHHTLPSPPTTKRTRTLLYIPLTVPGLQKSNAFWCVL